MTSMRIFPGPLTAALIVTALAACSGKPASGPPPPANVGILVLAPQRAELHAELPGRTVAYRIAQVRPQVDGIVLKRLFTEGAMVRAGQPMYLIDPGAYQTTFDSAQAAVAKAEANRVTAKLKHDRALRLGAIGAVSTQDKDDAAAVLQQAEADLAGAQAHLRAASISLSDTHISAPIAGRSSTSTVTEGALVTTNQAQPLTTVQQLDPMYVDLTQSSAELLRLRADLGAKAPASGAAASTKAGSKPGAKASTKATVRLQLEDGSTYAHEGVLEFTGVTVSESTGAVTLRAVFPNPEGQLLPGMFVRALVDQGVDEHAILVPQSAVSRNERGEPVALVVGAGNKAEQRRLRTEQGSDNQWRVLSGLQAGDRLIVDGLQRVHSGSDVNAQPAVAAPAR